MTVKAKLWIAVSVWTCLLIAVFVLALTSSGCVEEPIQVEEHYLRLEPVRYIPYVTQDSAKGKQLIVLLVDVSGRMKLKVLEEIPAGENPFSRCVVHLKEIRARERKYRLAVAKRKKVQQQVQKLQTQTAQLQEELVRLKSDEAALVQKEREWTASLSDLEVPTVVHIPAQPKSRPASQSAGFPWIDEYE